MGNETQGTITCPQCEGVPDTCNGYCEGIGTVTPTHAAEWHRQNPKPQEKTLCIHCGEPVHVATEAEKANLFDKGFQWKHDSGFWGCMDGNGNEAQGTALEVAAQPKAGKTLADFARTRTPLFKRPMHGHPHGFIPGNEHLKEIHTFDRRGKHYTIAHLPQLTSEDLTAIDWQEVMEPESFDDEARR